jgi:V8-like Glu-specific endopeptidase
MTVSSDTIGGSSGSPVVTAAGEIVGANFDSTVLTQRNAYGYDRNVNRSRHRHHRRGDHGPA